MRNKENRENTQNGPTTKRTGQTALGGEKLVNADTIGLQYDVSGRYILKLAAEGKIRCLRIGPKCVRFSRSEVARDLGAGK